MKIESVRKTEDTLYIIMNDEKNTYYVKNEFFENEIYTMHQTEIYKTDLRNPTEIFKLGQEELAEMKIKLKQEKKKINMHLLYNDHGDLDALLKYVGIYLEYCSRLESRYNMPMVLPPDYVALLNNGRRKQV